MRCTRPVLERCKTGPVEVVERPCGVCPACKANRAQMWTYRLYAELKLHNKAVFVTLTYDEEHIKKLRRATNGLYSLSKKEAQDFFKRLRKFIYPQKIRFFLAGEYGETTKRAHFHAIIYGLGLDDRPVIEKAWQRGFVQVGDVTPSSIAYVARYCTKKLLVDGKEYKALDLEPEFSLMSNRPGLGFNAIKKGLKRGEDGNYFVWYQGRRMAAPKYFKDKVRTEYEKLVGRFRACSSADERVVEYDESGRNEIEEQLQAERNILASRRLRNRL